MGQSIPPHEDTQAMRDVLVQNKVEDWYPVVEFWHSPERIEWFHNRGYTLYERVYSESGSPTPYAIPSLPFEEVVGCSYPYAYHNAKLIVEPGVPLRAKDRSGKVIYAQDEQLRHVAIKMILTDSDEYRILRFLHDKGLETLQENCIVPVLELLLFDEFCFAVMPRWGVRVEDKKNRTTNEILCIIHSMLKGLTFLHAHNIIHRDVKMENVLINYFADDASRKIHPCRVELQREGKLSYALMDFNISIMAPSDMKGQDYRLPYRLSFDGSYNQPNDTKQGEFDYDPFAFDVGMLGVELCRHFQHHSRDLPMLAPLLDKMTTWDIKSRFTAAEALRFFEQMRSELTEDQLKMVERENEVELVAHDEYDRWQDLPEDFQRKWAAYRQRPLPFTMKVLRNVYYIECLPPSFIPSIRLFVFRLTCIPRSIWTRFVGLRGKLQSILLK